MSDLTEQGDNSADEQVDTGQKKKRQPLSEAERAQIKFLLRTLVIIVVLVIIAVTVAGVIVTVIY